MNIWIVNYYCAPPEYDTHGRHLAFAHYLQNHGHKVTIIMAGSHGQRDFVKEYDGAKYKNVRYGDYNFIHIKCVHYSGNGLKRMFSIFQFACRLFFKRKKFEKPNVILHNIHEPFDYPILWCAKKLKAKYIVEDWDLWTMSFVKLGFILSNGLIARLLFKLQLNLFNEADAIVFSYEGGKDYIRWKKWDLESGGKIDLKKVYYINNGVDLRTFDNNKNEFQLDDSDLRDNTKQKVTYLGAISKTNEIKLLIDAAEVLQKANIIFLIFGDGDEREEMESYCKLKKIKNVLFKNKFIPYKYVPYVVSCSRINILNYFKDFGIWGISAGKLFQYLAAGKPICGNINMKYNIIEQNNIGISREYASPQEYADAILSLLNLSENEYNDMCKRVRETAEQYDYKVLSEKLLCLINNL